MSQHTERTFDKEAAYLPQGGQKDESMRGSEGQRNRFVSQVSFQGSTYWPNLLLQDPSPGSHHGLLRVSLANNHTFKTRAFSGTFKIKKNNNNGSYLRKKQESVSHHIPYAFSSLCIYCVIIIMQILQWESWATQSSETALWLCFLIFVSLISIPVTVCNICQVNAFVQILQLTPEACTFPPTPITERKEQNWKDKLELSGRVL